MIIISFKVLDQLNVLPTETILLLPLPLSTVVPTSTQAMPSRALTQLHHGITVTILQQPVTVNSPTQLL